MVSAECIVSLASVVDRFIMGAQTAGAIFTCRKRIKVGVITCYLYGLRSKKASTINLMRSKSLVKPVFLIVF